MSDGHDFPTLEVTRRTETGKGPNRRLRNAGQVAGVVYGAGKEPVPVQLDRRKILELFRGGATENTIFLLRLGETGQERHARIREMQVDPLDRRILHIDFQRILMTQKLKVQVPIEIVGVAYGVKTEGGVLDHVNREIEVECLPDRIPRSIPLDVTEMRIGQHVEASQLTLPEGVDLVDSGDKVIVSLSHAKHAAEATAEGEGLVESDKAEPEVIKKGKTEEA